MDDSRMRLYLITSERIREHRAAQRAAVARAARLAPATRVAAGRSAGTEVPAATVAAFTTRKGRP